jgi:hypothetical protein
MDNLLAGTLFSLFMEFLCRLIVQRRHLDGSSSVENTPLQAERYSGAPQKVFAFPPESVFAFRPEYCSDSQRNAVRLHNGIAFAFDRIPQLSANQSKTAALLGSWAVSCGQISGLYNFEISGLL